jgi:Family of unknown function (DUF6241)
MSKKWLIIAGLLVFLAGIGFFVFNIINKKSVIITETSAKTINNSGTFIEIQEINKEPIEKEFPANMKEFEIRDAIHRMSHQKIKAEEKWGYIPLTKERVNRLLTIIEQNEYKNANIYIDILNRWGENDFKQVDEDHNVIWRLQGGTIGKATGILSVKEEKKVLIEEFNVKENSLK